MKLQQYHSFHMPLKKDNYIQYEKFAEKQFREAIKGNTNFANYKVEDVVEYFAKSFFSENDFVIVKEDLKMNLKLLLFYLILIL